MIRTEFNRVKIYLKMLSSNITRNYIRGVRIASFNQRSYIYIMYIEQNLVN